MDINDKCHSITDPLDPLELECLVTAFDEVLIDGDLTNCDITDLEYPSESKLKCNKCSLGLEVTEHMSVCSSTPTTKYL